MDKPNPGEKLVSGIKNAPSQTVDTLTAGPARRAVSDKVNSVSKTFGDAMNNVESAAKNEWNQFKSLTGSDDKTAKAPTGPNAAHPNAYKDGGEVKKTGLALVHKGEKVIPADEHDDHKMETVHLSKHRVVMHLHKGGLHRALGVPEGETIPKEKVAAATHSSNPHVAKMAHLAQTMSHWGK